MRIIAFITASADVKRILGSIGEPSEPVPLTPSRTSPEETFEFDDGLLVNSRHLSHLDTRVSRLISEACGVLNDQPDLTDKDPTGRSPHELPEIDKYSTTSILQAMLAEVEAKVAYAGKSGPGN